MTYPNLLTNFANGLLKLHKMIYSKHQYSSVSCKNAIFIILLMISTFLYSCSTIKHVPEGYYLLDEVKINIDGETDATDKELYYFLRQTPNHKVLGFAKL